MSFDPVLALELSAATVHNALFASLTSINPETFDVDPYLAKSWQPSGDLKTWTFKLQENAKWHDGRPITSEDVRFTFERIMDRTEGAVRRGLIADDYERIEVVDATTFRFILKNPNGLWPDILSIGSFQPLPKHILEGRKLTDATEFNTRRPVGSGPFKMRNAVSGSHFELEAFDDFFLGRPYLQGLIFKIVPDVNVQIAQLKAGDLDWITIEPVNVRTIETDRRFKIIRAATSRYLAMEWHLGSLFDFFQDRRVRLAMTHAVDREGILKRIGLGMGALSDSLLPPSIKWAYNTTLKFIPHDPDRAKQLLAEAGWKDTNSDGVLDKDGKPFRFYQLVDKGNPTREQIGLVMQQQFKAVGIDVDYIVAERGGRYLEETLGRKAPSRIIIRPTTHPDNLRRFYTSDASSNFGVYSNLEVDRTLISATRTADRQAQRRLYLKAQETLHRNPPVMVIYYPEEIMAHGIRLNGVPRGEILYATAYTHKIWLGP